MGQFEPPSSVSKRNSSRASLFLIGKDSKGHWVVQDEGGLHGGLFVDRAKALRFALSENGNRPHAVIMVPGVFELEMGRSNISHRAIQPEDVSMRRVA